MFSVLPTFLLSRIAAIQVTSSEVNQHIQYTDNNGDHVWQSTSDFIPVQSKSFGNITIGDEMSMTFDYVWNGHRSSSLTHQSGGMFFRVGANADDGGNDCEGNWNRYPALQITNDDSPSLILYLSEIGSCSRYFELSSFGSITRGVSYHVVITFDHSTLYVSIAEKGLLPRFAEWNRRGTLPEWIGEVVPVWWMSDKFGSTEYDPANGTFSNITIRSKLVGNENENDTVPIPSLRPSVQTLAPTTIPVAMAITNSPTDLNVDISSIPNNDDSDDIIKYKNEWIIVSIISLTLFLCVSLVMSLYAVCQWTQTKTQSKQREIELADFGKIISENESFKFPAERVDADPLSPDPMSKSPDSGLTVTSTVPIIITPPPPVAGSTFPDRFKSITFDSETMYNVIHVTAMAEDDKSKVMSGSLPSLPSSMPQSIMEMARTPTSTDHKRPPYDHDDIQQLQVPALLHVKEGASMQFKQ